VVHNSGAGSLSLASDGNFYGTCYPVGYGPQHVCKVTTSGVVTPIFEFPTGSNGLLPAFLTQGSDGFLYGVAIGGRSRESLERAVRPSSWVTLPPSFLLM
jgi:hypothetical protein